MRKKGLVAFRKGDYDQAIEMWERSLKRKENNDLSVALAEVYFRRGLKRLYSQPPAPSDGLNDLKRAFTLQPNETRYAYHVGLGTHHLGNLQEARRLYVRVRKSDSQFVERTPYPLAQSILQSGGDPTTHPIWEELTDQERGWLTQAQVFDRRPYTLPSEAPAVWRAAAALDAGEDEQAQALFDAVLENETSKPIERQLAQYYSGVLTAQREDWEESCRLWNEAYEAGLRMYRLKENLQEAHHRWAEDLLAADETEKALAAALEAQRHGSSPSLEALISQAHQRLAYQAAQAGELELAREHWEQADLAGDGGFRLAYNLALIHERTEEFIEAGERWRETLRRRPRRDDHPDSIDDDEVAKLWSRAAHAYTKAGEYDEAVQVYRHAVKYNPDHIKTRLDLAETMLSNGQIQAAENELDRILNRDPKNIPALLRMGEVKTARGRWYGENPSSYWEKVLEIEPDNGIARQLLAEHYQNEADYWLSWGRHYQAIEYYQLALEYNPKDGVLLAAMGRCHLLIGEVEEGWAYFEKALALSPNNLQIYQEIIRAWFDEGDPDQAWEVLEQMEAVLDDVPYEFYLNQALSCIQKYTGAVVAPWLERVIATAPRAVPILVLIGEIAMTAGEFELGQEYLERAIEIGQAPGQAYFILGQLAMRDGDNETAEKHWREAYRIALRTGDEDLTEQIRIARLLLDMPPEIRNWLAKLGPDAFGDPPDFWDDDEEWDDDDYF